ncbi:uncharacterized protein C6orf226 homolog [Grus americana]|uniref:uncharacterized protein C6orf226 homolog n=1 Tax=Grus americana TaxID=9117 RepID=UPI0024079AB9|nr:uncharacterized protein C6orf226 homolog [Grus americana]
MAPPAPPPRTGGTAHRTPRSRWYRPGRAMERAPAPAAPPPAPSFAEVLQLVRSGRELPGVRRAHASPTGDTPTPSRLPLPTKPWENRSGLARPCSQHSENQEPPWLSTQQPGGSSDIA